MRRVCFRWRNFAGRILSSGGRRQRQTKITGFDPANRYSTGEQLSPVFRFLNSSSWPGSSPQVGSTRLVAHNYRTKVGRARLSVPSMSLWLRSKDVDARDKRGHDKGSAATMLGEACAS